MADLNLKALRALLAKAVANGMKLPVSESKDVTEREDSSENGLIVAAVNALPALLDLADAVRELAPVLAILSADNKHPMQPAARRVLAILEGK